MFQVFYHNITYRYLFHSKHPAVSVLQGMIRQAFKMPKGRKELDMFPEPTRRRLVQLAQLLARYERGRRMTSRELHELTGWSDSVIRRDILLLGYKKGASNGYDAEDLRHAICAALHIGCGESGPRNCCIVGLGRLGAALLENSIFDGTPFRIVAGFDSSVNRTEVLRSSFPLYPAARLENVIQELHISFALLTVPEKEAQPMAARLAAVGIQGIVNYTAAVLSVPASVAVENVSPVTALTNLSARGADTSNIE